MSRRAVMLSMSMSLFFACSKEPPRAPEPAPATSASSAAGSCSSDDECMIQSSYCAGCACLAMRVGSSAPECPSKPVQCLVDPCREKKPRCVDGACKAD